MKNQKVIRSTSQLSRILQLTPRRIQQLVKLGMPKLGPNRYPLEECATFYIDFLQKNLERKGADMADGTLTLFREEKSRTMRVAAELKELELARKRALVVTVEDSKKAFEDFAHMIKARVRAIPPRLADEVLGETSRSMVQAIIEKAIDGALSLAAKDGSNYPNVA
jgi:phage terminase Nu1 subunit (DNA packaging protein)